MGETEEHWIASPRGRDGWGLSYNPTPGGQKNGDGTTTYHVRFPALIVSEWVEKPEEAARGLAAELNALPIVRAALQEAQTALATMIDPANIRATSVLHAYAQCVAAEASARAALALARPIIEPAVREEG
ncbi:MAG TPA: hypothetical protein VGN97_12145 [Mesorhizobium sp.]|jgi:hypothetical protein|nr:hypothetical protein [Mesorhizobium sp.]